MNSITEKESKLLVLQYIKGISEKIERICCPLNIKVNFLTSTTLRKLLVHVKQATPMEKKKGVYTAHHAWTAIQCMWVKLAGI